MAYSRSSPWAGVTVARVHRRTPRRHVSICVHRIPHAAVRDINRYFAFTLLLSISLLLSLLLLSLLLLSLLSLLLLSLLF